MFLPAGSAPLKKFIATHVVVIFLTLQDAFGGNLRASRLSVSPYLRSTDYQSANQLRLRRTSSPSITAGGQGAPSWNLAEDYIRPERIAYKGNTWLNCIVPYTIDPKFKSNEQALITKAFEEYATKTCIRFVPKTSKDEDYVNIQLDNRVCGLANVCRKGGKQFAKIGRKNKCMKLNTVLHELGHSICLSHEHMREDRDDYIKLTDKSDKKDRNNRKAGSDHTTLGLMYDYKSVMHYDCPHFFKAKFAAVKNCGKGDHLSVLDAEKINSLYNCSGCHSYRFRQPYQAEKDITAIVGVDTDGKKLGVCRGYLNGDIIPGKYRLGEAECHIPEGKKSINSPKTLRS